MARKIPSVKVKDLDEVPTLFHLSFDGDLPKRLSPRLPGGMVVGEASTVGKEKESKYPEPDWIKRISFSTNIHGCVVATYPNWWHYFESEEYNYPYVEMWVYEAILSASNELVTNETLMEERLVWDAPVTKEWWILNDVKVKKIGKIRVMNANNEPPLYIHPYGDKNEPLVEAGPRKFQLR